MRKILLIGYGNPGRLDDGLGPALAASVEKEQIPNLKIESDYQLCVEDAAEIADYDTVIFADASTEGTEPFEFVGIGPSDETSFTSHALSPEAVLGLAGKFFNKIPEAYLLKIRGYDFDEFGEKLSEKARRNLDSAVLFIRDFMKDHSADKQCHKGANYA